MSKDTQRKLRESFRPVLAVQNIAELKKANPNLLYKSIRYDAHMDPDGTKLDRFMDRGWSIVTTKDNSIVDDRSTTKSKDDDSLRVKPLTWKGKGTSGAEFLVLSIPKEDHLANQRANAKRDADLLRARQKVTRKNGELHIQGDEINATNVNNNSEE